MKKKLEIEPRLRAFLKQKRVLQKFERNCIAYGSTYVSMLGGGFMFKDSPEGPDFWWPLYREYNNTKKP